MPDTRHIRASLPDDADAIERLYKEAFPEEDLVPLVRDLLSAGNEVTSHVAVTNGAMTGHVAFTDCSLSGGPQSVSLLGPLAVAPSSQRKGVAAALVLAGLKQAEAAGIARVFVLGDPAYYGRFGFKPDDLVAPPYRLPEEWAGAWQSLNLGGEDIEPGQSLIVPDPWKKPALWSP